MIFGMTYMQICWYFLLYSFLGWCVEVVYHAAALGKIINRGFLNGPVCPVYGFGMLGILAMLNILGNSNVADANIFELFIGGSILCSAIELFAGWLLDVCFHARWWNYSDEPFNLHGYICLKFSLLWGVAVVAVIKGVHPFLEKFSITNINPTYAWWIILILYIIYFIDFILTVATLIGLNKRLKAIDEASDRIRMVSDNITVSLGDATLAAQSAADEAKVKAELMKEDINEQKEITSANMKEIRADLKESREKASAEFDARMKETKDYIHNRMIMRRMSKAFPEADFHEHNRIIKQLKENNKKV